MPDESLSADVTDCLNCGSSLRGGRFCSSCGQDHAHPRLAFDQLAKDALDELFSLDGRWARTLAAFVPHFGRLADDYVAGRRARYVSPIRCFLVALVLFFLGQEVFLAVVEMDGTRPSRWLPIGLLLYAPFIALLLKRLFSRSGRTLAETTAFVLYGMGPLTVLTGLLIIYVMLQLIGFSALPGWVDESILISFLLLCALYIGASAGYFFRVHMAWATVAVSAAALLMIVIAFGVIDLLS